LFPTLVEERLEEVVEAEDGGRHLRGTFRQRDDA
jgi:hypothetical protein